MRPLDDCRYLCSEMVSVLYEDRFRSTRRAIANLEDISTRTATLLCDQEIEPGQPVAFCSKGHDLYGVVSSSACEPLLGWYVTLRLQPASRWSPQWFQPEHLFPVSVAKESEANDPVGVLTTKAFILEQQSGC